MPGQGVPPTDCCEPPAQVVAVVMERLYCCIRTDRAESRAERRGLGQAAGQGHGCTRDGRGTTVDLKLGDRERIVCWLGPGPAASRPSSVTASAFAAAEDTCRHVVAAGSAADGRPRPLFHFPPGIRERPGHPPGVPNLSESQGSEPSPEGHFLMFGLPPCLPSILFA